MKAIFLSASVPDPRRDPRYHSTADLVAIRDAIRALATVVLPYASLYWGGHPAITPLIRVVAENVGITGGGRVRLFQSAWFSDVLPADNAAFESYELTPKMATREDSLKAMRQSMLSAAAFDAGIFIGGMEGVEEEFGMFRVGHPSAAALPVASTGAAAAILYDREREQLSLPAELRDEYAYPSLFRRLLELPVGSGDGR
jgi:SLOG cluster3 family